MMFRFFKPRHTAPVARDRLKVLLAHERAFLGKPDLIAVLREEILAVIGEHPLGDGIGRHNVPVLVEHQGSVGQRFEKHLDARHT